LADSLALVSLLNNNPGPWTNQVNWSDNSATLDTWDNITLNAEGRVTSLSITGGGMTGDLTADLRVLSALAVLDLSNNELTGSIPDQFSQLTGLITLNLSNNKLESLPDLSGLTALTTFDVRNNNLLFSSLEPNISNITYIPQDSILNSGGDFRFDSGTEYTMRVPDDSPNNDYQWFFEGVAIDNASSFEYTIFDLSRTNMGRYHCRVQNSVVNDLTIFSELNVILAEAEISGTVKVNETDVLSEGAVLLLKVNDGAYDTIDTTPSSYCYRVLSVQRYTGRLCSHCGSI